MKAFDPNYKLLDEMYQDDYYPAFLVDKVKDELQKVIALLESGETDTEVVQETLDEAVCGINDLQEEFDENDSEIETVARECIAATVAYILEWFGIPIDTEEAIRERNPMAEKELALCDECGSLFFKGSSQMMGLCQNVPMFSMATRIVTIIFRMAGV